MQRIAAWATVMVALTGVTVCGCASHHGSPAAPTDPSATPTAPSVSSPASSLASWFTNVAVGPANSAPGATPPSTSSVGPGPGFTFSEPGTVGATPPPPTGLGSGIVNNGLLTSIVAQNALFQSGVVNFPLSLDGLNQTPAAVAALTATSVRALDGLTDGQANRMLLSYLVECALPDGAALDLNLSGNDYGWYAGHVGLAPQWATGACAADCQEWVTACVLARTNKVGAKVPIYITGSHPALSTTPDPTYPLAEGSYYGNAFSTVVLSATGNWTPAPIIAMGSCSNTFDQPYVTKRFCASLYGGCPQQENGDCSSACVSGTCTYYSGKPNLGGLLGLPREGAVTFTRILTVALQQPMPICGNGVCDVGETVATCAADCLSGWTSILDLNANANRRAIVRAVPLSDGGVARIGYAASQVGSTYVGEVTNLDSAGQSRWARPYQSSVDPAQLVGAASANGEVTVAWSTLSYTDVASAVVERIGPTGTNRWQRSIAGAVVTQVRGLVDDHVLLGLQTYATSLDLGGPRPLAATAGSTWVVEYDPNGAFVGVFGAGGVSAATSSTVVFAGAGVSQYTRTGQLEWSASLPSLTSATAAIGPSGEVVVVGGYSMSGAAPLVVSFAGQTLNCGLTGAWISKHTSTGQEVWAHCFASIDSLFPLFNDAIIKPSGEIVVVGGLAESTLAQFGSVLAGNTDVLLVSFGADGTVANVRHLGLFSDEIATSVALTPAGGLVVGGSAKGVTNLGQETLRSSTYTAKFVLGYTGMSANGYTPTNQWSYMDFALNLPDGF